MIDLVAGQVTPRVTTSPGLCIFEGWPALARRDLFLRVLEQARQRCRFVVVGYVIMPEHFH